LILQALLVFGLTVCRDGNYSIVTAHKIQVVGKRLNSSLAGIMGYFLDPDLHIGRLLPAK
jgi:hypothetical protein